MAEKNGDFELSSRQKTRYDRYDKQEASELEKYLKTVRQIEKN